MVCDFFLTRCVMRPSPIYQFYLRHSPKIELSQEGLKGWILTKSENLNISVKIPPPDLRFFVQINFMLICRFRMYLV